LKYVHHENSENMRTSEKKSGKKFDAVKYMRDQRNELSHKLSKMTKKEIIEYFKKIKTETTIKPGS
jgi:hypothetical protein